MSSDGSNCCCCASKMGEDNHDFMARAGEAALVVKDVPALICDTCGGVEYTLETSREIDVIMKYFFAGRLLAKPLAAGGGCQGQEPARRRKGGRGYILNRLL